LTVTRGSHIAAVCFRLRSPPDLYFATHTLPRAASRGDRTHAKTRVHCTSRRCAAATTAWLLSARAQQSSGVRRIALLVSGNADHQALKTALAAFQQELASRPAARGGLALAN
jgi:hypothetical protein